MDRFIAGKANAIKDRTVGLTSFSIVVPTYGIPLEFVRDFVESLKRQTFQNWELCICDDGDPNPAVAKYLKGLCLTNPEQFQFVRSDRNVGICGATKTALSLARHPYVILADADDLLHRRALELIATVILEHPDCDFVYSNHDYMTEWGLRLHPMIKPAWSPELLLHINYINHLKVVRRDLLESIAESAFDAQFNGAQDWSLCFQILLKAKRVMHLPFFLYHWRARKGSMANDVFSKPWAVESQVRLRRQIIDRLSDSLEFKAEQNLCFINRVPEIAIINLEEFEETKAIKPFIEAIRDQVAAETGEFLFFAAAPPGDKTALHNLAGYCTLPRVACVWPFQSGGMRTSYTIARSNGHATTLVPQRSHRGSYSWYSGNVLCGPLSGLMIRRSVFNALTDTILKDPLPSTYEGQCADVVGVLLSIAALEQGLRNASVHTFEHQSDYAPVTLPVAFLPAVDPYL